MRMMLVKPGDIMLLFVLLILYLHVCLWWVVALGGIRRSALTARQRFTWTVFVTLVPLVGSIAFLIVAPEDGAASGWRPCHVVAWRLRLLQVASMFVAALLGVLVAEFLVRRHDVLNPLLCRSDIPYKHYNHVELLASRVQQTGVYVRYRNTGNKTLTRAYFRFKYYEGDRLIEETQEAYWEEVPAGGISEGIIVPSRDDGREVRSAIALTGQTVRVISMGGYAD